MELQKAPTMTRTQEWSCLSAQQLVHQLLVCDIERARRFVQANAKTGWRRGRDSNPQPSDPKSQPGANSSDLRRSSGEEISESLLK
jgi:hypothetical protein